MSISSALVTGGLGFVGSEIVKALAKKHPDCAITILDIQPPRPDGRYPAGARYAQADITVPDEAMSALNNTKPTIVIHTAGIVPYGSARYRREQQALVWAVNFGGTKNVLDAAQQAGVKAVVFTSSYTVVTDDLSCDFPNLDESVPVIKRSMIYGESKAAAEDLVLAASDDDFATCALRPPGVIGPGGPPMISIIHACIAKGETPFIIGPGYNLIDAIYVSNVADAHILAAENLLSTRSAAGEAFYISNGEPVPFRDFCLALWANFGHIPQCELRIPKTLALAAGYLGEWIAWMNGSTWTLSRGSAMEACATRYSNGAKAETLLGYKPRIDLVEGLRVSCEDYKIQLANMGREH